MDCQHEWEALTRHHIGTEEGSAESLRRKGVRSVKTWRVDT